MLPCHMLGSMLKEGCCDRTGKIEGALKICNIDISAHGVSSAARGNAIVPCASRQWCVSSHPRGPMDNCTEMYVYTWAHPIYEHLALVIDPFLSVAQLATSRGQVHVASTCTGACGEQAVS